MKKKTKQKQGDYADIMAERVSCFWTKENWRGDGSRGRSAWCRIRGIKVDNKSTRVEALDRGPEFTVCRLGSSKPCVFVDNCAGGR